MFRATFGTMASGKTKQMIETIEKERANGNKTCCLLPEIMRCRDSSIGSPKSRGGIVKSRDGTQTECIFVDQNVNLETMFTKPEDSSYPFEPVKLVDIIFVDEIQFFPPSQVEQLKKISKVIRVYTYGLLRDCDRREFDPSRLCLALSDQHDELFAKCEECCDGVSYQDYLATGQRIAKVANGNVNGNVGSETFIGINDRYLSLCFDCVEKMKLSYFDHEVFRG